MPRAEPGVTLTAMRYLVRWFRGVVLGGGLDVIIERLTLMATTLDQLTADVQANSTVIGSAVALLQGLKAQLDAAGTDPVALAALSSQLEAQTKALSDAIVANTPAAAPST